MKKIIFILLSIFVFQLSSCDLNELLPEDPKLDLTFLGYTDYYQGSSIALKFDIKNNSDKTIVYFRPKIKLYFKYGDGSGTFYPDVYLTINPDQKIRSYWIPVCTGMVFYQDHDIDKIYIEYDDFSHETIE